MGYVGTFQEWHGIGEILKAASSVISTHPNTVFLMVGPYYKDTEEKVSALGFSKSFIFTGPVEYNNVPRNLRASDILIAPYDPQKIVASEQVRKHGLGSPLKLFEYMSVGKPVITTSVEPISSIIDDHLNGILIPPGDSIALERAIEELIDNSSLANALGRNARELVLQKYSWVNIAQKICKVLKDAIIDRDSLRSELVVSARSGSR